MSGSILRWRLLLSEQLRLATFLAPRFATLSSTSCITQIQPSWIPLNMSSKKGGTETVVYDRLKRVIPFLRLFVRPFFVVYSGFGIFLLLDVSMLQGLPQPYYRPSARSVFCDSMEDCESCSRNRERAGEVCCKHTCDVNHGGD